MNKTTSYIYLAIAMTFVGSSVVVGKIIATNMPVSFASMLSLFVASLILVPLLLCKEGIPKLSKKDLFLLVLQTLAGTFLYRIFLLNGLKYTGAIESGMIKSTAPVVMLILAIIFLKEKPSRSKYIGIAATMLGILVAQLYKSNIGSDGSDGVLLGMFLVSLSVIAETLFSITAKALSPEVSTLTISTAVSFFGLLMFLPMSLIELRNYDVHEISFTEILSVVYYGVFVTAIACLLWFKGLKEVDASIAGVFAGVVPITSTILSVVMLNEKLYVAHVVGIFMVILGILFVTKKS